MSTWKAEPYSVTTDPQCEQLAFTVLFKYNAFGQKIVREHLICVPVLSTLTQLAT